MVETEEEINNTFGKDAWDDSDVVGDDFFDTFGVGIDNEEKAAAQLRKPVRRVPLPHPFANLYCHW